jgi:hypothetical protein
MKQCTKCKEFKLALEFSKDKYKKDGLRSNCKSCYSVYDKQNYWKNPEKARKRTNEYRAFLRQTDPVKLKLSNRNTKLKKAYGITQEQFLEMSLKQKHKCACCNKEKKLVVDHCHTTGKIRELLCHNCNTALGLLNEDNTIIQSLSNYIRKQHGNIQVCANRQHGRV